MTRKVFLTSMGVIAAGMIFTYVIVPHIKRAPDAKTAWTEPRSTPIPIPDIINPFETDEERAEKEKRKGFIILNQSAQPWARVSRDDNGDVTEGLPPELTDFHLKDGIEPITSREADGWHVRFIVKATPTPSGP